MRRLAYDFRPWTQLEATGRSGSDDGFDARGFEPVLQVSTVARDEASEDLEEATRIIPRSASGSSNASEKRPSHRKSLAST